MLAEFKYGLEPKESFASFLGDQAVPRAAYYYLKKDFFPWTYWNFMVRAVQRFYLSVALFDRRASSTGEGQLVWSLGFHPAHI